ncbi:type VII secretion target [Saccharomonospora sp. CUA-673]|uniref:type VII secretion target n=1 Tax=Saccharomonospora sp. CUA-673 TaxID=1904969 RepID=UPI00210177BC|nr:type VII secretion target [Saccharomonospora sp. CUA-673]
MGGKAESVGTAAEAASHVADLGDAYGIICQQMGLPMILMGPQQRCAQMIADAQKDLQQLSDNLTKAADAYDEQERATSARLKRLAEELGRSGNFDGPNGGGCVPMPNPTPPLPPGTRPTPMPPGDDGAVPTPTPMPTPMPPPGGGEPVPMPTPTPPRGGDVPPPAPMPTPLPPPVTEPGQGDVREV